LQFSSSPHHLSPQHAPFEGQIPDGGLEIQISSCENLSAMLLVGNRVCGSTCGEVVSCENKRFEACRLIGATALNAMLQVLSCWYCKKKTPAVEGWRCG